MEQKVDSKIQAVERKFLRGILKNKTRKKKIRNTIIRDELKVEEIKNDIEINR